jgi:hypothetical protein
MDLRWSEEEDRTPRRVKSHPETAGSHLLAISVWNDEDTSSLANRFEVFTSFDKMKLSAALLLAIKKIRERTSPAGEFISNRSSRGARILPLP